VETFSLLINNENECPLNTRNDTKRAKENMSPDYAEKTFKIIGLRHQSEELL